LSEIEKRKESRSKGRGEKGLIKRKKDVPEIDLTRDREQVREKKREKKTAQSSSRLAD